MNPDPSSIWAAAGGHHVPSGFLSYVDGDAVGFDARLRLPRLCLACGGRSSLQKRTHRLRLASGVDTYIAQAFGNTHPADWRLRSGDPVELVLPVCASCVAAQQRSTWLRAIVRTSPASWLLLVVVASRISCAIVGPVALGLFLLFAALAVWSHARRARDLVVERVDSDGVVRLRGVHPDAAEAIQLASARGGA